MIDDPNKWTTSDILYFFYIPNKWWSLKAWKQAWKFRGHVHEELIKRIQK